MRESMLRQTLHLLLASDTQKILFSFAQMTLCIMTLCNFSPFIRPFKWSDKWDVDKLIISLAVLLFNSLCYIEMFVLK